MRVAYLGPPGTYSHEALLAVSEHAVPGDLEPVEAASVYAAVIAVQEGEADRALVPIENSVEGSVNATVDALALVAEGVEIVGEVVRAVHHCLIAAAPMELAAIGVVRSHPQATGQCAQFLREVLPGARVEAAASTAEAVRAVMRTAGSRGEVGAAIASAAAAERYGAVVLRENVEDVAGNETRFAWLAPAGSEPVVLGAAGASSGDAVWKTSVLWWGTGSSAAGWLVRCLSEFAFRGVNLTRIVSRPRRDTPGEYRFYVDLDGRVTDPPVAEAIAALRTQAGEVRVLGSFPRAG